MNVLNKTEPSEKAAQTKGVLRTHEAPSGYSFKRSFPSAELAPFVEHYWIARWDLPQGQVYENEILPCPNVTVTITADDDMISGVATGALKRTLSGRGAAVGITFLPGGFYPFFKKPIERLTNQSLPLKTVFQQQRVKKIRESLHESDAALVDLVEKMLIARNPQLDGSIALIGDIIENAKHDTTVRTVQPLLETYGVSERTMQYAFKNYLGVGLKWIILRYRLQDVADAIAGGRDDWATIAQELGFADQAHVMRDFKKVFGETPAEYAERTAKDNKHS